MQPSVVQGYLDALDHYDTDQFATFLADDVSVQFNMMRL
jgi:hypothetical protein